MQVHRCQDIECPAPKPKKRQSPLKPGRVLLWKVLRFHMRTAIHLAAALLAECKEQEVVVILIGYKVRKAATALQMCSLPRLEVLGLLARLHHCVAGPSEFLRLALCFA